MTRLSSWYARIRGTAVAWSMAVFAMRVGSSLLLLPLLRQPWVLSASDAGMYIVLNQLYMLVPLLDIGFSVSLGRSISYAAGGAEELTPMGVPPVSRNSSPNKVLLWQLLHAMRRFYRLIAAGGLVLMGVWGTFYVSAVVAQSDRPVMAWTAWGITLLSGVWEVYSNWWNIYLSGLNEVRQSARFSFLFFSVRFVIAAALLASGAGLLAVPIAGLVAGTLQRAIARKACLAWLGPEPEGLQRIDGRLFRILWPNTWRVGLQLLSNFAAANVNMLICSRMFSLATTGDYGFSVQLIAAVQGVAMVWTFVKWPLINQLRSRADFHGIERVLAPRFWLQFGTFAACGALGIWLVPDLLALLKGKGLLSRTWLILFAVNAWLELQFTFWTTFLGTENRVPSLWPTVATNIANVSIVSVLVFAFGWGPAALAVGPLTAGLLFNYWFWPFEGARVLGTSWMRFTFGFLFSFVRKFLSSRHALI